MKLTLQGLQDGGAWAEAGIALPAFDLSAMRQRTFDAPAWVHFGAGNIFRAFPCAILQQLLDAGLYDRGVIAFEAYDPEIVDRAYRPYDCLSLLALLHADGNVPCRVIGSVAEAYGPDAGGMERMKAVFASPSLQMVSLTVTEKAYTPDNPMMHLLSTLLAARYANTQTPVALVSMDNCAHNGDKLREALLPAVQAMIASGQAPEGFAAYVQEHVAFPITMIDKITPHPAPQIAQMLRDKGVEGMDILHTAKGTVTAAFVNAEAAQYLVIEDAFPNGRPPLDKAGIIFTDRDTVDRVEKMKVGTCLNPLHTALAILGCLLGYTKISTEMTDEDIRRFVYRLGYAESLPVVEDPGVISPRMFLDEVLTKRVNNPFLIDTPQRIATDTSQKLPVRFAWTIQATPDPSGLVCVPFVFAAWLRYLTGVDDKGQPMELASDPRMAEVQARMREGITDALLSDASLFGADLVKIELASKVRTMYDAMMQGNGAVRDTLHALVEGWHA